MKQGPRGCMNCGAVEETDKHVFLECSAAVAIWKELAAVTVHKIPAQRSFKDWFETVMETRAQTEVELVGIMLWLIWKSINELLFEGTKRGAAQVCTYGQNFLQDYQEAQAKRLVSMGYSSDSCSNITWKPPAEGHLKINVDDAFSGDKAGVGVVIRDTAGEIQAVMVENVPFCYDPEHAEIMGFWKALDFAHESGITHMELEGDAINVVNRINSSQPDFSRTGHLITDIRQLTKEFLSLKISYVNRKLNTPAHAAARIALNVTYRKVWYSDFPASVLNAVTNVVPP